MDKNAGLPLIAVEAKSDQIQMSSARCSQQDLLIRLSMFLVKSTGSEFV